MPEPTPYLSQCLGERTRARVVSVENRMAIILKKKGEGNGLRPVHEIFEKAGSTIYISFTGLLTRIICKTPHPVILLAYYTLQTYVRQRRKHRNQTECLVSVQSGPDVIIYAAMLLAIPSFFLPFHVHCSNVVCRCKYSMYNNLNVSASRM